MNQRPQEGERRDRGYTLIEMLIAIVLMGTIVLSIMGGMWAVVRASRQNDERAKVQAVLGAAGDRISSLEYDACPQDDLSYEKFAQWAAESVGWEPGQVRIIDYKYWNPASDGWDANNSIQTADCNEMIGLTTSKTLQRLTLQATAPSGSYSATLDIVKANIAPKEVRDVSTP